MRTEATRSLHHHVNTPPSASLSASPTHDLEVDAVKHPSTPSPKGKGKARALSALDTTCVSTSSRDSDHDKTPPAGLRAVKAPTLNQEVPQDGEDDEWCLICHSSPILDKTVLPLCLHSQFCFHCILRWSAIKRKCPLCQTEIGEHVIHAIRQDDDFLRYHLPPVPSTTTLVSSSLSRSPAAGARTDRTGMVRQVQRARAQRQPLDAETAFHRSLSFRKHIYQHSLFAAHVGSNRHTSYRPCPTPSQVRHDVAHAGGEHIARRINLFVRRELQIWPHVDVEFLTKYILSLMQVFDVGQDETVRLVGEFLGERVARHLLHELECFLRSGKRELRFYDQSALLQYGRERKRRVWRTPGGSSPRREQGQVDGSVGASDTPQGLPSEGEAPVRWDVASRRTKLLDRLEKEKALLASSMTL